MSALWSFRLWPYRKRVLRVPLQHGEKWGTRTAFAFLERNPGHTTTKWKMHFSTKWKKWRQRGQLAVELIKLELLDGSTQVNQDTVLLTPLGCGKGMQRARETERWAKTYRILWLSHWNDIWDCQVAQGAKNVPANAGDTGDEGSVPGSGRSPGGGNGTAPIFLPGESHGQRSLPGYSLWGC